jgi:hypothetical protein
LSINNDTELHYPHRFQTTKPGRYSFSVKNYLYSSGNEPVLIQAIDGIPNERVSIPVIFHFVNTTNTKVTTKEKLEIQLLLGSNLETVNRAFANELNSSDPNAFASGLKFFLADKAPDGLLLNWKGVNFIDRINNPFDDNQEFEKYTYDSVFWLPKKYVNIWVVDAPFDKTRKWNWAYFPDLTNSQSSYPKNLYGVVLQQSSISNLAQSQTFTHELGHFFNLMHVFSNSCQYDADGCSDTWSYQRDPFDNTAFFDRIKLSCSKVRFISTNVMDYYPGDRNTITYQQCKIIEATINSCSFLPTKRNGFSGGRLGIAKVSNPLNDNRIVCF